MPMVYNSFENFSSSENYTKEGGEVHVAYSCPHERKAKVYFE